MIIRKVQRTTAGCVVLNKGKILFTQRRDGRWEIPKGRIEYGEDPRNTAKRELKEETGLIALKTKFLGYTSTTNEYQKFRTHLICVVFLVTEFTGNLKIQEKEVKNYKWATISEALQLNPIHHLTLPILLHFKNKGFTRLQE